jgi:hypothetical protein
MSHCDFLHLSSHGNYAHKIPIRDSGVLSLQLARAIDARSLISCDLFVLQWARRREKERGKEMGKHGKKHKESNH